jgi:hypothetical protein
MLIHDRLEAVNHIASGQLAAGRLKGVLADHQDVLGRRVAKTFLAGRRLKGERHRRDARGPGLSELARGRAIETALCGLVVGTF